MEESQFYEKKPLITFSEPYQTAPKKIQCIELEGAKRNVIIICVYMPANGSKTHQVEYQECIDELHEI
jgi:exonuclease III